MVALLQNMNPAVFAGLEGLSDMETERLISGLAAIGQAVAAKVKPEEVRQIILREASGPIAKLVAKDLNRNPHARRLVVQTYLKSPDPMKDYREVAAYDFMEALFRAMPDDFTTIPMWEEEPEEETLVGLMLASLGKKKGRAKLRKRLKKVGKYVAIGAAVAGAVALCIATGGAAAPALASAGGTAFQMQQARQKAKAEKKAIKKAEAELAALNVPLTPPPVGENASTLQATVEAAQASPQAQANPVAQGAIQATGDIAGSVIPQSMASYAAGQVQGKTPEQIEQEFGIKKDEIVSGRIDEAGAVAAGAEPSKETPGWVLPAAIGGGGLLVALAAGVF